MNLPDSKSHLPSQTSSLCCPCLPTLMKLPKPRIIIIFIITFTTSHMQYIMRFSRESSSSDHMNAVNLTFSHSSQEKMLQLSYSRPC